MQTDQSIPADSWLCRVVITQHCADEAPMIIVYLMCTCIVRWTLLLVGKSWLYLSSLFVSSSLMWLYVWCGTVGRIQTFERGIQSLQPDDWGLIAKRKFILCKAQMHAKHATTRGVWGHAPRKFWKIASSEVDFEMICDSLMVLYM